MYLLLVEWYFVLVDECVAYSPLMTDSDNLFDFNTRKYVREYVLVVCTTTVMSWYCVHTVCACVHSSCFFRWDILLFISGRKSGCVCVCALTAKQISFLNHRNRKVVGGAHNVLVHYIDDFEPNLSGVVLCNPFIWFLLLFISKHTHICCLLSAALKYHPTISIIIFLR